MTETRRKALETGRKRFIQISKEDREFIMKSFKVTDRTVQYAVYFNKTKGDTDTARRIRKLALDRGGVYMVEAPECETIFDHEGNMYQRFNNGAELITYKEDGKQEVWFKDKRVYQHVGDMYLTELYRLQDWAAALE